MKMKKFMSMKFVFFAIVLFAVLTQGCTDLAKLKDDASVRSVAVLTHSPTSILLGTPEINEEKHIVSIPVLYGKYQFPLTMTLKIETSNGQTIGLDFKDPVTFQSITERKKFFVVAESGLAVAWYLELVENALPEGNYIEKFEIKGLSPASNIISMNPEIKATEGKIDILGAALTFPLTITPDIIISDDATMTGYENGKPMVFKSVEDIKALKVTSASGNTRNWTVSVIQCKNLPEDASRPELNGVDFDQLSPEIVNTENTHRILLERTWNVRTGVIDLYVRDTVDNSTIYPVTFNFDKIVLPQHSELIGMPDSKNLTFESAETTQVFYTIDRMNNTMRKWDVKALKGLSNQADITAIEGAKSGTFPLGISVDGFTIYPQEKKVVMTVSGLFTSKLTVNLTKLTVSTGAKVIDQPSKLEFANADAVATIKVEAEDGTMANWLIIPKSRNAHKSDRAEVVSYKISQYESKTNKMVLSNMVYIDQTTKEVVLIVDEGGWDFPLKVKGTMTTSPYSHIEPAENGVLISPYEWLNFENSNSVIPFDVVAEDGTVVRWNMSVKASGNANNEANLNGITFSEDPTNVIISQEYFMDTQNHIVYFQVASGVDKFPLVIRPVFEVSKGAITDVPNNTPMTFQNLNSTNQVTITSEDGANTVTWTIKLIYTPQLDNSNFEKWVSETEIYAGANSWASSNNTFVKGMRRSEDAVQGRYSVQMTTSKVDNLFAKEIAAGSLFLGTFKFDIGNKDNPRLMTWFGSPFTQSPNKVVIDVNYKRGATLEQSKNNQFIPIPGEVDSASVIVELLRWTGPANEPFEYHGVPTPNVEVLGNGSFVFTDTNGWIEDKEISVRYTSINKPTHISLSMASSAKGDQFIGARDSRLLVDNVRLVYPQTPEGPYIVSKQR